ncbi:hypothetical protein GOV06_04180, partial [Candidatus Woesearchaeota archaeon]|nr:hypothetical protein [Candidatus Woesearchaeota archaeon]
IIALQEVYSNKDKEFIINQMKKDYPYSAYKGKNGFLFLSKYKIVDFNFTPYSAQTIEERFLIPPGVLYMKIMLNKKLINLFNVRLTAGAVFRKQESSSTQRIQIKQISQVLELAKNVKEPSILLGDFNSGPTMLTDTFTMILQAGYLDVLDSKRKNYTWDPKNNLNDNGHYKNSPAQRIDHIFVPHEWKVSRASLQFTKPVVSVEKGKKVALSDHSGVQGIVEIK